MGIPNMGYYVIANGLFSLLTYITLDNLFYIVLHTHQNTHPPNLVKILPRLICLDLTMHSARLPLRDPLGTLEKVLISTIRPIILHRCPQKHHHIWQGHPKSLVTID